MEFARPLNSGILAIGRVAGERSSVILLLTDHRQPMQQGCGHCRAQSYTSCRDNGIQCSVILAQDLYMPVVQYLSFAHTRSDHTIDLPRSLSKRTGTVALMTEAA